MHKPCHGARVPTPALRPALGLSASLVLGLVCLTACGDEPDPRKPGPLFPFDAGGFPDAGDENDGAVDPSTDCDGSAIGSSQSRTRYEAATVPADQTCTVQTQVRTCQAEGTWSAWSGTYTAESCQVEGKANCEDQPHGTTQTRMRYEAESVGTDEECSQESQARACDDGTWSEWSGTFGFETCEVEGMASCEGEPHGSEQQRTRFEAADVQPGEACESEVQTRECADGAWSEWDGTFTEEACEELEHASCGDEPHGTLEERDRYAAELVEDGETCEKEEQTRRCTDGEWSDWTGEFTAEFCDVEGKKRCDQDTADGESETRIRFSAASVPFGSVCQSEEQSRLCTNGTFGDWSGNYTFETCAPAGPAACGDQPHGATITRNRYATATVPYGSSCVVQLQTSSCSNGTWGAWSGNATFEVCDVLPPADCVGGAHADSQTRVRYQAAQVPFGSQCAQQDQSRTCNNGSWSNWSGTYTAETCAVQAAASCDGVAHGSNQTRTRWQVGSVAPGQMCRSQEQTRTCSNGTWGAWSGTYAATSCGRQCSVGGTVYQHGTSQTRARYASAFPSDSCQKGNQTRTCDDGAMGAWSTDFRFEGCSPLPAVDDKVVSCRSVEDFVPQCHEYRGNNTDDFDCDSGETRDETRGCPTDGTVYAKCEYLDGTASFYWEPEDFDALNCTLGAGTWTVF
jgi:hypothetical protein